MSAVRSHHDREAQFTSEFDQALMTFGLRGLKTPVRTPTANSYSGRHVRTLGRDCLDFDIPINERHVRSVLRQYVGYYNRDRPHSALGLGIPGPPQAQVPTAHTGIDSHPPRG
jgi:transposase InsO family protein